MSSTIFQLSTLLLVSSCSALPQNLIDGQITSGRLTSGGFNDGFSRGGGNILDGGISSGVGNIVSGGISSGVGNTVSGGISSGSTGSIVSSSGVSGGAVGGEFITLTDNSCPFGQARNNNGGCVNAKVTKSLHLFDSPPAQSVRVNEAGPLPAPRIHYSYVFIKAPKTEGRASHLVAPADQQKTIVYVLQEKAGSVDQQILRADSQLNEPEVFFVRHNSDGSSNNRQLPGGIDLATALREAEKNGQFIDLSNAVSGSSSIGGSNVGGTVLGGSSVGAASIGAGSVGGSIFEGSVAGDGSFGGTSDGGVSTGQIFNGQGLQFSQSA